MKVLHVFRSPVGGLFRHVRDLARGQHGLGHDIGVICDSVTGGSAAEAELDALARYCRLGIHRIAIPTLPGWGDIAARNAVMAKARQLGAEILHGHGAKGGVYARLAAWALKVPGVYTPHGGSLHYDWLKPPGALYLAAEKALRRKGTGLIFVCEFERRLYDSKIGLAHCPNTVVYNGLWPEDFAARKLNPNAADLFFIGEMRALKGVDVLLRALAGLPEGQRPRLNLIGEGHDMAAFQSLADSLDLSKQVQFLGRMNFAAAAKTGLIMVMPSRNESFPYVVLEALAAGVPLIATDVGGIPEVLPRDALVPIGNSAALGGAIAQAIANPVLMESKAGQLRQQAQSKYNAQLMAKSISEFYFKL